MKKNGFAALAALCLSLVVNGAHAFRDDFPADPERDCAASASAGASWRAQCALAAIDRACSGDPSKLVPELAAALDVTGVQVRKAMGRHTLASLDKGGLCARGEDERRRVVAASVQAKKAPSEAAQEWLLRELGGPEGTIDHAAVAEALERRRAMLAEPRAKRAGLPGTPAGWTNLTGYVQSPGRINHILFTSATGNDILAASDGGGIWRSTNGGTSWTPVNDFLGSLSIANFAKAANNASTIYAATNTRGSHTYFPFGIIKSLDGGATWSQLAQTNPATNSDFTYVQRVAVHPSNASEVLAATDRGAYRSTDGGANWARVGASTTRAYYVAFHPTDVNRQAVAYDDGTILYTTTGNLSASTPVTVLAGGRYMKLAYAKSDVDRMYALVTDAANVATPNVTRLFMSTNAGANWAEVAGSADTLTAQGTFYNAGYLRFTGCLWVDPLNANRVAVCEAWASFTADVTASPVVWKDLVSGWVDFHGIVEHPGYDGVTNRTVFWMDDGGLYRTTDIDVLDTNPNPFTQFTRIETGLAVTQVYSVSGHGGNTIFGAQDIGPKVYRTDGVDLTNKWRLIPRPVDSVCAFGCTWIGDGMTTAASTSNPSVLYGSRQYLDLFRSTDGGATAVSLALGSALNEGRGATAPNFNAAFIAPFVLDPSNQSRMYAGGHSLWRTSNVDTGNPPTWTKIRDPFVETACSYTAPVSLIAVAPSNPDIVWIAHECAGRVFKTANATAPVPVWSEVTTLPSPDARLRAKASILIDPVNPDIVWIGLAQYLTTGTLFRTTDGGTTAGGWTKINGLPGAPVYALLQHPASASWLYAATGVGLFASIDGGATWSTSNEGPANVVVRSLDWNSTGASSELLLGTYGRGVYKATVGFVAPAASTTTLVASTASAAPGASVTFTATVSGAAGVATGSVTFRDGGVDIGTVALNVSGQAVLATMSLGLGSHGVTAHYSGSATYASSASPVASVTIVAPDPPRLANISTRMQVLTGNDVMIGGFVIGGSGNKTVVVRARGPSLVPFGIANAIANPQLQLVRSSDQATIATNDDWGAAANAAAITASGFAPDNALEAAILVSLPPGAYTAIVSGVGGATGVGIIEVFEVDQPATPLVNISTRGQVLTGNDVMIGGFVIQGSGPQTVVVRARGPSLVPFGIANALANPTLQLVRSSDSATLAANDNWGSAANAAAITASGFAPSNALESAILITLDPGAYTAIVSGVGGGTGVAIVEVFAQ